MAEIHSFNTEFAALYGIEEAIVFGNIHFWCKNHKRKGENKKISNNEPEETRKERYWVYFTQKELASTYSYLNETKIHRVLKHLEAEGLILIDVFNKLPFDRTRWYTVTEKGEAALKLANNNDSDFLYPNEEWKFQNEKSECGKMKDDKLQNEVTIPNNKTNIKTDNRNSDDTLSAQSSSEADSTSESSSSNQSANPISLAEREELRKKDEEIKELKAFVSEQKKVIQSMKKEIKNKDSKPVKQTKTRKTKTDEELQTLFSDFSESDIQITTNCINNFITVKQRNDPRFMRSRNQLDNWSYELLLFSKTQNRDLNEVATVWNWAINDYFWSGTINSVSAFIKKYETLIQKCNSRQNRGYQSRPKYNAIDFENQNYNEIF